MSLLFGYWNYNSCASLTNTLRDMYKGVEVFPHDKYQLHEQNPVGIGCLLHHNTPESVLENQPIYLPDKQILFAAQGRLNNREKLAISLGIKAIEQSSDGYLLSQAFQQFGKDCVQHLRGDWSFALYDQRAEELFIARDHLGYTTLFYMQDDSGFYFSSNIKSLLALPHYKKELNELHFVQHLTLWNETQNSGSTYYKNIFCLPPAHTLTVKNKKITVEKYWNPSSIALRHYKNKQDYANEMLELMNASVRSCLRSYRPVASMLSGGLDSSTVSYLAAEQLKAQNIPLTTFSHTPLFSEELKNDWLNTQRVLDETPFIMQTAEASGNINAQLLQSADYSIIDGVKDFIHICNAPAHGAANLYWLLDIYKTAASKGFGTLLSGEGGNGTISFSGFDDQLPFNFSRFALHPYLFVRNQVIKPIAKTYFSKRLYKRNKMHNTHLELLSQMHIQSAILEQYGIIKDIVDNKKELYQLSENLQKRKALFIDLYKVRSIFGVACGQYFGLELRDPTTDVDLIEYFFSLPNEVFFDEHYNNRMLVKRMMKGKLPDSVLLEKRKGLQSADIAHRAIAQADEIIQTILFVMKSPAANHYMDTKKLLTACKTHFKEPHTNSLALQKRLKALQFALFLQLNFD